MGVVTKPFTFTNGPGNIIDAAEVNADLDALYTLQNNNIEAPNIKAGSGIYDSYRTIFDARIGAAGTSGAGTFIMDESGSGVVSGAAAGAPPKIFYLDLADYAVTGKTTKGHTRAACFVNGTAPTGLIRVALVTVTAVGGGPNVVTYTFSEVASLGVSFGTPLANSRNQGVSGDSGFPGAGYYAYALVLAAPLPANCAISCHCQLRARST